MTEQERAAAYLTDLERRLEYRRRRALELAGDEQARAALAAAWAPALEQPTADRYTRVAP